MAFAFSFSGEDIEDTADKALPLLRSQAHQVQPGASAFPVEGKPQLYPNYYDHHNMLCRLPSKIAYGLLDVTLDDGSTIQLPRRELWDVRVQLMAEAEDGEELVGLGNHDVKTGVYEGGFKSWESSVDLVKVLAAGAHFQRATQRPTRVIEVRTS
jgi:protein-histidine N-methyltransferase